MSEISVFMDPQTILGILSDVARKSGLNIVVQRYTSDGGSACVHMVQPNEELSEVFVTGGYSKGYLTTAVPNNSADLQFLRSDDDLAHTIVINGGRAAGQVLERCNIHILFKKTKVRKAYNAIRRAVKKVCDQGILVDGKWPYPRVFWERALVDDSREWRASFEDARPHTPMLTKQGADA